MKNFLTFLVLAVIVVVIVVLIKKPSSNDMTGGNDAAGTMPEGSEAPNDPNIVGGDAAVNVEIGGQGDTIQQ